MSSPLLGHRPPRVVVTNSMLYAYNAMRGNSDKQIPNHGPLHGALYLDLRSVSGLEAEGQIYLPKMSWSEYIQRG
jgi:hypothetical protein